MNKTEYKSLGETLYTATLPNGLPIYVLTKPGFRKCFAAFAADYGGADRRFVLGGGMHDTPAGVAHYLEHKMFDTEDGNALVRLEANGASPNAFTSDTMTLYHFECTSKFEENLRELLSFVSVPYFTAESVAKEQGIIGQEIRMTEDSPDYRLYINLMRSLFASNPLRDGVAGTVESIAEITPETLYNCHKAFYHPSNMALAVVGDVDPALVERVAREILTPEPAEKPRVDYGPEESLEPLAGCISEAMEVSLPQFAAGLKMGPAPHGEAALRERIVGGMALKCLFGRSSAFYTRLYSEGLLNTDFSCEADFAAGQAFAMFGGESRDPEKVLEEIKKEIAAVGQTGFDEDFFLRQKKASYGQRIRALGNFEGLAVSLAESHFCGYQPLDAFGVLESVSAEECARWVREKLKTENIALSVISPKE